MPKVVKSSPREMILKIKESVKRNKRIKNCRRFTQICPRLNARRSFKMVKRYLKMHPNTIQEVLKEINLDKPGEMKEAVRILDEWVRQQKHFLKKDFPPAYLEATIISAKGSVERAKGLLDRVCTYRTMMPRYFEICQNDDEVLKRSCCIFYMPELTTEHYRVLVMKCRGKFSDPELMDYAKRQMFYAMDYTKLYDNNKGVVIIYDISEVDLLDALTKVNLLELRSCYMALLETFGLRLKKVHIISTSKLIDTLLSFFSQVLKKKIMDRIVKHDRIEELREFSYSDILPEEYGGAGKSLHDAHDEYLEEIASEEYQQHLRCMSRAGVDESLRPAAQFNDLYAGTYGTFRTLTLD